jgi:AcrR family transcriptional regulator
VPRAGLTTSRVIAAAADIADSDGLERLTLAAVARRCGVTLPGLYKHTGGLDDVRRGVAVLAVRELAAVLAAATAGRSGRDALEALAAAYRQYAAAHPGRAAASVRAPAPGDAEHAEAGAAAVAVLAAVLRGYGIEGDDAIDAIRVIRAALHGFVTLEAAGGFGLPQSVGTTFARLVATLDTSFAAWGVSPAPASR